MPALRISDGIEEVQQPEPFRNEYELQETLAENPGIFVEHGELSVMTVCREFTLDNGFIDILLVDSNGLPVIVEAKLSRNGESRREVIGQLTDYLSALAKLTVEELNERSGGSLEEVLRRIAGIEDEEKQEDRYNLIWSKFASCLSTGQIRGIIALDRAPDDLIREFSYMNEHSDLDLRLMAVERYRLNRSEYFWHSRYLVAGGGNQEANQQRLRFRQIVEKFSKMKPTEFSTRITGKENVSVYREGWPASVHYEFCDWTDSIGIELQVRHAEHPKVSEFIPKLSEHLSTVIRDAERVEQYDDPYGWTRLRFFFADDIDPYLVASAMQRLCMTEKDITTLLQDESG